jgi:hypothetical protein
LLPDFFFFPDDFFFPMPASSSADSPRELTSSSLVNRGTAEHNEAQELDVRVSPCRVWDLVRQWLRSAWLAFSFSVRARIDQQSVVALLHQHNDWLRNNWPDLTADALCNLHACLLGGLWKRLPHQEYFVLLLRHHAGAMWILVVMDLFFVEKKVWK